MEDIMNQFPGVTNSMVMTNNSAIPYVWIMTAEENKTEDFKQRLINYMLEKTEDKLVIKGIIFIDKFPRTSNGKISRALMMSILNNQPCQIPVSDRAFLNEIKRSCYEQVGDVNAS
jgi:acyl-coenzyme A synthetase/AMP-(fatty) acid ligase